MDYLMEFCFLWYINKEERYYIKRIDLFVKRQIKKDEKFGNLLYRFICEYFFQFMDGFFVLSCFKIFLKEQKLCGYFFLGSYLNY